jgi:diadenylate cyclase
MRQFLRNRVFNNFGLKLFSLFLAVLLWLAVTHDPMAEVAVNVPIEFHHVPENLEISSENIPQAQIRVRGPARIIRELAQAEIHPIIDLQGAIPGERTYDLTAKEIRLPHNTEVVQIVPTQFRVSFDKRAQRDVEVRPRVIGTFAAGYRISQATAEPNSITIVGPEKRVKAIENAITDPVDASGVIGRATFTTNAYISDPMVRPAKPGAIRVTVTTEKSSRPGVP